MTRDQLAWGALRPVRAAMLQEGNLSVWFSFCRGTMHRYLDGTSRVL